MMNQRASHLAARLEQGANALVEFAETLSPAEWQTRLPGAAAAISGLSDRQLQEAASVSLYAGAPVTCRFVLEDHVRHSSHHLDGIRRALAR
jgi:hypothetical protein